MLSPPDSEKVFPSAEEELQGPKETFPDSSFLHSEVGNPGTTPALKSIFPETCPQSDKEKSNQENVGREELLSRDYICRWGQAGDEESQTPGTHSPLLGNSREAEEDRNPVSTPNTENASLPQEASLAHSPADTPPTLRQRYSSRAPAMPTIPEEEEDSPGDVDSSSSSPVSYTPVTSRTVNMGFPPPSIVLPKEANTGSRDPKPLELASHRPQSPRNRLSRSPPTSGIPITTVDSDGHVIDLLKDQLPELQLSEEDTRKNLELLEEAKKVSDRFLTRRGRRSISNLSDSPTGLSPGPTPRSSPVPSRSSSLTVPPHIDASEVMYTTPLTTQNLVVPVVREQGGANTQDLANSRNLLDWKPSEKRKVSSGTLSPRYATATAVPKEDRDPQLSGDRGKKGVTPAAIAERVGEEAFRRAGPRAEASPGPTVLSSGPLAQQAPCTAEIKTMGAFPPLMRAVSWDAVGSLPSRDELLNFSSKGQESCPVSETLADSLLKSSGYKDFPVQPVKVQKLTKLREDNKLMRNQTIGGSKLPDLSETAEQEQAPPTEEESKEKSDVMPNISDIMLRKLKLHRVLPGSAPALSEKEVENAFVQLALAFRNDSYTLETRLRHAEKERNITEDNNEKELEEFQCCLKGSVTLWQNMEQRESFQRLLETVAVLHRLAVRLSSRAEMVGAVRQEKRMNKAMEVMMQYVENLKRTYEKDHAELMEFKKLANQNSNRCYGGSMETGDDGVPRTSRSMSVSLGKALPRRRVSVAVVPKFNLLNIPGQTPPGTGQALPALGEANSAKCGTSPEAAQQAGSESGDKAPGDQENEMAAQAKPAAPSTVDEISADIKAKIEEEAYNKGYQEGLKKSKELQKLKEVEEEMEEKQEEEGLKEQELQEAVQEKKCRRKYNEALEVLDRLWLRLSKRNHLFWITVTLFAVVVFVVSVVTYFSGRYAEAEDTSASMTVSPSKKKFFGWNAALQPKKPEAE